MFAHRRPRVSWLMDTRNGPDWPRYAGVNGPLMARPLAASNFRSGVWPIGRDWWILWEVPAEVVVCQLGDEFVTPDAPTNPVAAVAEARELVRVKRTVTKQDTAGLPYGLDVGDAAIEHPRSTNSCCGRNFWLTPVEQAHDHGS